MDIRAYFKIRPSLIKSGHEVFYLSWVKRKGDFELFSMVREDDNTIPVISYLSDPGSSKLIRLYETINAMSEILKKVLNVNPDIIIVNSPYFLPIALFIRFRHGIPFIYDVYEDYYGLGYGRYIISGFEKISLNFARAIISTTPSLGNKFGQNIENRVVYNSVYRNFESVKGGLRELLGYGTSDFVVGYFGMLSKERGIQKLLDAVKMIDDPHVKLLIIGGPQGYAQRLRNSIGKENINRIQIQDQVPFRDIWKYYSALDLGIIPFQKAPNHNKTIPNKLFDYMVNRIPIIAADLEEYLNVFPREAGIIFYVDCTKSVDIANSIEYLKDNPEIRMNLANNARNIFDTKYSWDIQERKLEFLFSNLNRS